ncbi:DUF348 domain-containing protein [Oceanobacillus piezotolerans]|uniref:DUF348 domain-containing protein n=1 Tax=Oceanobacillus piezotolerans TaxID=2448030 RepID=A0A498D737_9BACI|nr:G5 and 3D domain-containing protein [Oceanobacillus piezotolerans]RLL41694.1 DUF348 domain-containing protein [Oceanobacillus piezotolerans]
MRIISKLLPASKWKLVISSIGVLALILFTSIVLFEATKAEVVVTDNGEQQPVKTHANTVEELLNELEIVVGEHDELSHDLSANIENNMNVEYKTAKEVTVTVDGNHYTYYTTEDTVGAFFEEQGLSFAANDDISHENSDEIINGGSITVVSAFEVIIDDGGKEKKIATTTSKVQDILTENNIKLNELDRVEPGLEQDIKEGNAITIVRVEEQEEEVVDTIAFQTETKQDHSLEKGKEKVVTDGKDGKVTKTYKVVMENGREVSRELLNEEVKEESVNKVVAVGTKEPEAGLVTLSHSNGEKVQTGGKTITMTASAFTSGCDGCSGYTATGINLQANPNAKVIAVDPSVIPLGTKVWVEGYGEAIAGDTGGSIKGNRIDVHVPSKSDAYGWGVRKVKVKILD